MIVNGVPTGRGPSVDDGQPWIILRPRHSDTSPRASTSFIGLDLEKFFDQVDHDGLMARIAAAQAHPGLSQGRFANDCNIYVQNRRAGGRIMRSVSGFLTVKRRPRGQRGEEIGYRLRN
jgi:hypothetical protein